jgi:hypothetical protein
VKIFECSSRVHSTYICTDEELIDQINLEDDGDEEEPFGYGEAPDNASYVISTAHRS